VQQTKLANSLVNFWAHDKILIDFDSRQSGGGLGKFTGRDQRYNHNATQWCRHSPPADPDSCNEHYYYVITEECIH